GPPRARPSRQASRPARPAPGCAAAGCGCRRRRRRLAAKHTDPPALCEPPRTTARRPESSIRLDRDAAGVVDAVEEQPDFLRGEIFVDRLATSGPVSIVVDDQHAAGAEARIEMLELVPGRLVPVSVQA